MNRVWAGVVAAAVLLTLLPGSAAAVEPALAPTAAVPCPEATAPLCLKLIVAADGLYRVRPEDLEAAGWNVATIDPRTLSLSSQGQPVALRVLGEGDGRLDATDYVEFYGQRLYGDQMVEKYTDDNVYWLAAGATPGPRMTTVDATPAGAPLAPPSFWTTHRAEENHHWFSHQTMFWATRDTWWWTRMYVRKSESQKDWGLITQLPAPAPESYNATLSIELATRRQYGMHHVQVRLNTPTQLVLDKTFAGHQLFRAESSVPSAWLMNPTNVVTVTVIVDQSAVQKLSAEDELRQEVLDALDPRPDDAGIDSPSAEYDELYANYYTLRYRRLYAAQNDQLVFTADDDQTGPHRFALTGFASANVLLYDISNPLQPVRLIGGQVTTDGNGLRTLTAQLAPTATSRFFALTAEKVLRPKQIVAPLPSTVRSTTNGADWIIVTHADFLPEAQRLANYRASHDGFRTKVVNVAELYDQFNYGIFHPEAIRRFVAYAVQNWQPPAPQYLVLMGDGNWNFKGYGEENYGVPDPNWIPPYLVWEDPYQGEVGSDNAFVNLDADPTPELSIGRLPARTLAEAKVMVDKIISYEAQLANPLNWRKLALFVADNQDSTGNYPWTAEVIIQNHVPVSVTPKRAFLEGTTPVPAEEVAKVTNAIITAINSGVLFVNYLGHGSVNVWAHEIIWSTTMTSQLTNADRLTMVFTMNCLDGYFIHGNPEFQSVAEEMLRSPVGATVAAWSPAGLGTLYYQYILNSALLDAFFRESINRLGPATARAKEILYATGGTNPNSTSLVHTMTIFGDPALIVQTPPAYWGWLPAITRKGQ